MALITQSHDKTLLAASNFPKISIKGVPKKNLEKMSFLITRNLIDYLLLMQYKRLLFRLVICRFRAILEGVLGHFGGILDDLGAIVLWLVPILGKSCSPERKSLPQNAALCTAQHAVEQRSYACQEKAFLLSFFRKAQITFC